MVFSVGASSRRKKFVVRQACGRSSQYVKLHRHHHRLRDVFRVHGNLLVLAGRAKRDQRYLSVVVGLLVVKCRLLVNRRPSTRRIADRQPNLNRHVVHS